ncbi:MAG: fibronectin type III-like domain-contianing protein, partial [Pseudomonadales bacterium]
ETQQLTFQLSSDELGFYSSDGVFNVEAGEFDVFVGGSSDSTLATSFNLIEAD